MPEKLICQSWKPVRKDAWVKESNTRPGLLKQQWWIISIEVGEQSSHCCSHPGAWRERIKCRCWLCRNTVSRTVIRWKGTNGPGLWHSVRFLLAVTKVWRRIVWFYRLSLIKPIRKPRVPFVLFFFLKKAHQSYLVTLIHNQIPEQLGVLCRCSWGLQLKSRLNDFSFVPFIVRH